MADRTVVIAKQIAWKIGRQYGIDPSLLLADAWMIVRKIEAWYVGDPDRFVKAAWTYAAPQVARVALVESGRRAKIQSRHRPPRTNREILYRIGSDPVSVVDDRDEIEVALRSMDETERSVVENVARGMTEKHACRIEGRSHTWLWHRRRRRDGSLPPA